MSTQISNVNDTQTLGDKTSIHEAAVAEIVGMIRAKYEDEGTRNFAIGGRAYKHAQWQKANFPGTYLNGDFDALMNRVRDDVRMWVPIKAESIRIAHWVRCHVLRELIRKEAGDVVAESLTMMEYMAIVGKALHFTVKDLEGEILPCWLDMVKGVAADRSADRRVVREDFENRVVETIKRAEAAKVAKLDPVKAATLAAGNAVKAEAAKVAKATKDITSSINDGIASGAITSEGALAILEGVAKHHGKPLVAASIGFDPLTATAEDCERMIAVMFSAGRITEIRAIVAKGNKAIAKFDKRVVKATGPVAEFAEAV